MSDYFKYPMTKDTNKDKKKKVFQKIEANGLQIHIEENTGVW